MTRGFVVTGTDTGVGKTVFSAALTGWLQGQYWKPVQAGLDDGSDTDTVARLSGCAAADIFPEAYRLTTACSPHQAAAMDGVSIDRHLLALPVTDKSLVVEGAGGVLVPLAENLRYADIFADWQLPVILVARTTLGTINHSLLSLEALRSRKVTVHGVVFIGDGNNETERVICKMGEVTNFGRLPFLDPLDRGSLAAAFTANIRTDLL